MTTNEQDVLDSLELQQEIEDMRLADAMDETGNSVIILFLVIIFVLFGIGAFISMRSEAETKALTETVSTE